MINSTTSLSAFHPLIHSWFLDTIGSPTDIQEKAWPKIASGGHVLITAPTGSGKTLTAFLWAFNKLILGEVPSGVTSILYVSPLKALNNDIQRNLLGPLDELKDVFKKAGEPFPDIRVLTRSGDTPQPDRRRMQRPPPEILITTPESLNLLLSSIGDRSILIRLSTTILDEIHAVFGDRRGVHLITALEFLPRIVPALYVEDLPIESLFPGERNPIRIPDPTHDDSEDREENFRSLIGDWLTFYGPKSRAALLAALGVEGSRLQLALEDLLDSQKIIIGQLVTESDDEVVCDSDNFETLLRIKRAEAIPAFEPLNIKYLPLFLAVYHGIADPKDTLEGLYNRLEQLLCYQAPAAQWESEILPTRLRNYNRAWLDSLFQERNLKWVGRGIQKVVFCFEPDLDLFDEEIDREPVDNGNESEPDEPEPRRPVPSDLEALFPDASARYDFSTLLKISNMNSAKLAEILWKGVWHGRVTNDTFSVLRKGIQIKFQVPDLGAQNLGKPGGFRGRTGFARWKNAMPFAGNWHLLPTIAETDDLIEKEERNKDRVRLLLDRHGILFRELLRREAPAMQWFKVFRSLRIMELSGEVLTGCFFLDIPGPQFISPRALRTLRNKLPEDSVYWMNATDPASLLGVQIDALKGILPSRIPSTHLVYRGTKIVAVSQRVLTFHDPPEDPRIQEYLIVLRHLLTREFQPLHTITVETINDQDAAQSPYVEAFRVGFDVRMDYKSVKLFRKT